MKTLKLNTKTNLGFSVKLNMVGKSASEKLDCVKKIEKILNEKNGSVSTFQSLPYSRGGKYARHTSTLTNVLTFELINNNLSVQNSSKSANCPVFSVEVYSDLFLQKKKLELLSKIEIAKIEFNSFAKGIGFDFLQKQKNEIIAAEKKAEEIRINAEKVRSERIASGKILVEKPEDFFSVVKIDSDFMARRNELSKLSGLEKSKQQKEFFSNFLENNKIVISSEKLFWQIFTKTKIQPV